MLARRRAERRPEWTLLPAATPLRIHDLLRRCLEKDPKRRLRDIADAAYELDRPELSATQPDQPHRQSRLSTLALVGAAVLITAATTWLAVRPDEAAPQAPSRFAVSGLSPLLFDAFQTLALSPDGSVLAFRGRGSDGVERIYVRDFHSLELQPLAGTDGARMPFFSPDGQWIGFFSGNSLKKIPVGGGPAQTLAPASNAGGGAWLDDGTIVFVGNPEAGLERVQSTGGQVERLIKGSGVARQTFASPFALPGSKAVLLLKRDALTFDLVWYTFGEKDLTAARAGRVLADMGAHGPPVVSQGGRDPGRQVRSTDPHRQRHPVSGRPGCWQPAQLPDAPFLGQSRRNTRLRPRRRPWRNGLVDGVRGSWRQGNDDRGTRSSGRHSAPLPGRRSGRFPHTGAKLRHLGPRPDPRHHCPPHEGRGQPRGRMAARRLESDIRPHQPGRNRVIALAADGAGTAEVLFKIPGGIDRLPTSWVDGSNALLVQDRFTSDSGTDVTVVPAGGGQSTPLLRTPADEGGAVVSHDGQLLAFVSDESGRNEIYVRAYSGEGPRLLVSTNGGIEPVWARKGDELFYRTGRDILAVRIRRAPTVTALDAPKVIFSGDYPVGPQVANYDVSADGRFLMMKGRQWPEGQVIIVQNWFTDIRNKAR